MYYCAQSLGVLQHTPQISCHLCDLVCFGVAYSFRELSPKKYYNYLNNITKIWYCCGLAICTGASSNTILNDNLVRFGVCMIKLRHERMLILRCILPPKKLKYLQKKN